MQITHAQRNSRHFLFKAIAATALLFLGCLQPIRAQKEVPARAQKEVPAAQTVWQHVGRIYFNLQTGKAIYAGYVVRLNGVSESLFNGSPSESSAYFTFSTDVISLTPMAKNADLTPFLVSSGTFNVYYNPHPNGDWGNPATFSSGQLIATFKRNESLFPLFTTFGVHALSETLESSHAFTFNGQTYDMGQMVPNGITFASYFSSVLEYNSMMDDYPNAYAAAGSTIAVGSREHP
jgi:hypothetical protein